MIVAGLSETDGARDADGAKEMEGTEVSLEDGEGDGLKEAL